MGEGPLEYGECLLLRRGDGSSTDSSSVEGGSCKGAKYWSPLDSEEDVSGIVVKFAPMDGSVRVRDSWVGFLDVRAVAEETGGKEFERSSVKLRKPLRDEEVAGIDACLASGGALPLPWFEPDAGPCREGETDARLLSSVLRQGC